jgi:hypothetical protein
MRLFAKGPAGERPALKACRHGNTGRSRRAAIGPDYASIRMDADRHAQGDNTRLAQQTGAGTH